MGFATSKRAATWLRGVVAAMAVMALTGWGAALAAQGTGNVAGTVIDGVSSRPVSGASVLIPGTEWGTVTNEQGRFLLLNVPVGEHTVRFEMIGYESDNRTVNVEAGRTISVQFRVTQTAVELEELVVTGVVGTTPRAKLAFDVDKVTVEDLPVPAVNPAGYLQGRVAGARVMSGSGQPGEDMDILLRGATSINATGRSQGPLIIIDGIITTGGLQDVEAQDIASIEVVKGAAAASLYGSRAGNGVVQITTRRGQTLQGDRIRYTYRAEYGESDLPGSIDLSNNHPYLMNASRTKFVCYQANDPDCAPQSAGGTEFDYWEIDYDVQLAGGDIWNTFQENPFPGPNYDNISRFFNPGGYFQNHLAVEGASGRTNFYVSASTYQNQGVLRYNNGYDRTSLRVNVDHGLNDQVQISVSGAYSFADQDESNEGGGEFFDLTFMPPNVDLLAVCDQTAVDRGYCEEADGQLMIRPDPREDYENPIYPSKYRDWQDQTSRIMGSTIVRYSPASWFDLETNLSYDRSDWNRTIYYPKGYKSIGASLINTGRMDKEANFEDALNGSVTGSFNRAFGDLVTRTKVRYLYEAQTYEWFESGGHTLAVADVQDLDNNTDGYYTGSEHTDVRSEGYFLATGLDYKDRYLVDGLIRRDGSSLFGADERWQTYYRGSIAWRMALEPWWSIPAIDEFKLRYSLGTAGGRPNFYAQYQTYRLSSGSVSGGQTLGNRKLKPEFITENEAGVDMSLFGRVDLSFTYAKSVADDQILPVPLAGYAGFDQQWRNAGTLESETFEGSIGATLFQTSDFRWGVQFLADRTKSTITELGVPCYTWGISRQNLGGAFYNCAGEELGAIYGKRVATSTADLPAGIDGSLFQVNDMGYLVYVGSGNTWQDGVAKSLWGTTATLTDADGNDITYAWGAPWFASTFEKLGSVQPDLNFSVSNNLDWKGLNLYVLLDASLGFDVYNQTRQWAAYRSRAGEIDMEGVPDAERKPYGYFQVLYDAANVNSHYVEDASFVKLRELSLRYSFNRDQLSFLPISTERVTLSLVGRNLLTWTDYSGYDPEVGFSGQTGGSAVINRFDAYNYPNFRTFTGAIEIVF